MGKVYVRLKVVLIVLLIFIVCVDWYIIGGVVYLGICDGYWIVVVIMELVFFCVVLNKYGLLIC